MLCFISVLIARILYTVNQEYGEENRHLEAGNPRGFEKRPQPWSWSTERHSDFSCEEINKWFKLTNFNQTGSRIHLWCHVKVEVCISSYFHFEHVAEVMFYLCYSVFYAMAGHQHFVIHFLDQSDSRMVTWCCTWKQQMWVERIFFLFIHQKSLNYMTS